MVFQNDILAGAAGAGTGYTIDQSIRFNDNDSAYMSATLGTATDTDVYTISVWVKRGNLGLLNYIFSAGPVATTTEDFIGFQSNDTIFVRWAGTTRLVTTQVFRDPSAWYHVVLACDYAASGSDKAKLYINGAEVTAFTTDTRSSITGTNQRWNTSTLHYFGRNAPAGGQYLDGYLSEINFIDGQALAPTDFGEFNDDGVWIAKPFAGGYGSNGFYITGENSADLGADYSGNANDFTSSGLTSDDQVTDTPTENYATLNPLDRRATTYTTIGVSNGNLELDYKIGNAARSAFGDTLGGGKWVFEGTLLTAVGGSAYIGWSAANVDLNNLGTQGPLVLYSSNGNKYVSSTSGTGAPAISSYGASYTNGDVIRVETDFTASTIEFFKNGTSQGSISISGLNDGTRDYFPSVYGNNAKWKVNFGQQSFVGTPTAGFKALSTANLPTPTIADGSAYFQTTLYTGDGNATQTISQSENSTFNPDLVWIKNRSNAYAHNVNDAVRGYTGASPATAADVKVLATNATDREGLGDTLTTAIQRGFVQASTANGFIVNKGTAGSQDGFYTNASGHTYAAWQWLAANGTASNTDGSITSTVSANTTAGFSVIGYTGNATSGATIGHGLGVAPAMVITKSRDNGTGRNWAVYHAALGPTKYLELNGTDPAYVGSTRWNDTAPSSTVITLGSQQTTNDSGAAMIAYAFAEVEGFSKFGSYTGNGSADGPFVWCGFRPAWVMTKRTDSTSSWFIYDSVRDTDNETYNRLFADLTDAEVTSTAVGLDLLSNGFKLRNSNFNVNASGGSYIFAAFAEHPFGGDGVAPVPAR
jgi:hypothetical protein